MTTWLTTLPMTSLMTLLVIMPRALYGGMNNVSVKGVPCKSEAYIVAIRLHGMGGLWAGNIKLLGSRNHGKPRFTMRLSPWIAPQTRVHTAVHYPGSWREVRIIGGNVVLIG